MNKKEREKIIITTCIFADKKRYQLGEWLDVEKYYKYLKYNCRHVEANIILCST